MTGGWHNSWLLSLACFVVVAAGLSAAVSLVVPMLLAGFIALLCHQPIAWLGRFMPRALAVGLVLLTIVCVWGLMGVLVGASVADFVANVDDYQRRLQGLIDQMVVMLAGFGWDLGDSLETVDPAALIPLTGRLLGALGDVLGDIFLILLITLFILAEESSLVARLRLALSGGSGDAQRLMDIGGRINRYMAIKAALSLGTGAVVCLGLLVLGVDYPLLWGTLAFLLNFVPNLGSIIAAVPAVLLALIQLGPIAALLAASLYAVVNVVVGNVLEPRIMGRRLDLSPLVVLLSLVFWGWLLGPVGMLLSVPLTLAVRIALEGSGEYRALLALLAAEPPDPKEPADAPILLAAAPPALKNPADAPIKKSPKQPHGSEP